MMSDSLAAINVDQLSNAVNAVVNGQQQGQQSLNVTSSVAQNSLGLHIPTNSPVSIPSTVMIHVDRQLLSQLSLPPSVSTNEVSGIDNVLLQNSGGFPNNFNAAPPQQQSRSMQSNQPTIVAASNAPQNTLLTTQMMSAPSVPNRQQSFMQNNPVATVLGPQMLSVSSSNGSQAIPFNAPVNAPLNAMLGTQMMVPSIITSVVPGSTSQSAPLSTFLGSPLVVSRDGSLSAGITNALMTKQGGEQMIFNIQPEVPRGVNSGNSNNSVLQLVPISSSNSFTTNQQAAQNPMINMSIAIHLPTSGTQSNKDPNSTQKQARTIPFSQLMTGQPIPVSQITGPLQVSLEPTQERVALQPSSLPLPQLSNPQGISLSQIATQLSSSHGQSTGSIQPQMSIPLSQLGFAQAIPVSQIQLPDGAQQGTSCQLGSAPQQIQIPQSMLQSFQAHSMNSPSVTSTSTAPITTAMQVTASMPTPIQAPAVIPVQDMQGKPYWNIHSLDQGSQLNSAPQLTSQLTSHLTPSLTSQTLDVPSVTPKSQRQGEVDLGLVSISPEGLVTSMNADEMATLNLEATESMETLALPFEVVSSNIWCIDCNHYNPSTCTTHDPPTTIRDSEIPCKAKLTLPLMLKLSETLVSSHGNRNGVIAVQSIEARCQFGPLIGKIISKDDSVIETHSSRLWKIYRNGMVSHCIDVSDDENCNWMIYVKLANRTSEQNLVAHQSGGQIYFITNKLIKEGEELKIWYSKDYAQWQGVPETPESSFHCTQCPMHFFQRKQLIHHLGCKHPDMASRRYKCTLCPRAFISNTKLHLHMLTHMGLKPYKCEHCGKQFSDPSNLRIHTKIHTEEKRFICDVCQKAFRQKIHLIAHMTTHTGEKLLKCPFCELTFATHSTLRQHRYSHETTDQEFECEKCERKFKNQRILQKHVKTHSWKRDYQCSSCNKGFFTRYHAKRHYQNCKGPREERDKKREKMRSDGEEKVRKPRMRRSRPGRHQRRTSDSSSSQTHHEEGISCGTNTSIEEQFRGSDDYYVDGELTSTHQEESLEIDRELSRIVLETAECRAGPSRDLKWVPVGKSDGEVLQDQPTMHYHGDLNPSLTQSGVPSSLDDSSEDRQQRRRLKRGAATEPACLNQQSERQSGRPVRRRKTPKRYTNDEDHPPDRKADQVKDTQQRRGNRSIYTVSIADTTISIPMSSEQVDCNTDEASSSTAVDCTASHQVNIMHSLDSNILGDTTDTRGSPSNSLLPLIVGEDMQGSDLQTTIQVNSLEIPSTVVQEAGVSEPSPIATGSLSLETSTMSVPDMSPSGDAASGQYATRSSPMATRSMSMQMQRRESAGNVEQCDDEERAGTVNENVEE
ncbi:uncharacterized protein [Asterias amurensis]|uniref:uncharacterized protein isoform X1 n=1 Tax=Asterias amurensis TaxID=7602 RepID=UPI003AB3017B